MENKNTNSTTAFQHRKESKEKSIKAPMQSEMASYGTLRQFARTLGLKEAVSPIEATLAEEKTADKKLTEVAVSAVNVEASEEVEEGVETKSGR